VRLIDLLGGQASLVKPGVLADKVAEELRRSERLRHEASDAIAAAVEARLRIHARRTGEQTRRANRPAADSAISEPDAVEAAHDAETRASVDRLGR
jgi:hypothetical protein